MEQVSLTRSELYAQVWAEPLSTVAKRYSLSEYAFRQLCIRLSIPIPGGYHWNKVKAGQQIPQPPLPTGHRGEQSIQLKVKAEKPVQAPATNSTSQPRRSQLEDPLITAVRQHLGLRTKQGLHNGLAWAGGGYLSIGVAPPNIDRACALMNELLYALRARSYTVQIKNGATTVLVTKQPLPITLREKTKRITLPNSASSWERTQLVPSGVLALQLNHSHKQRQWDIRDSALPDEAAALVEKLEEASRAVDDYQEMLERGWAIQAEQRRVEQVERDRGQAELTGFKQLLQAASRWRQAQWIRDYLTTREQSNSATSDCSPDRAVWLAWARAKADWYDPLIEAPDEWLTHVNRDTLS